MPDTQAFMIDVPGVRTVSAIRTLPEATPANVVVVYAPGAGAGLSDPFGAYLAESMAAHGVESVRFQFPYKEAGRSAPDRPPVLEATWRAALAAVRANGVRIVASGRSMGGRIASQVAAAGEPVDALGLFAYPLHPPGHPEQRRDAHLSSLRLPVLFCSGSRDAFATPQELRDAANLVPESRVRLLMGADHGFSVLKSSGRTRADVHRSAVENLVSFLDAVL